AAARVAEAVRGSRARVARGLIIITLAAVALPADALAQRGSRRVPVSRAEGATESDRLRAAAALEADGDLAGAERVLESVLEKNPASLGALIALERVLAVEGRPEDLVAAVERLLDHDPGAVIGHQMLVRTYTAVGDEAALERAGDEWIAAMPEIETPYREIARAWRTLRQPERAIEVLTRGRERIDRPDALALELG